MLEQWSKLPENTVSFEPDPIPFNDEWADEFVRALYAGEITKANMSAEYHEKTGGYLMKGVVRGFKGRVIDFGTETDIGLTIRDLQKNIFQFSAAKQYQQVVAMSEYIYTNGLKANFKEFKTLAKNVFDTYNKGYLKAEFVTAVGQAQSARDWLYFDENKEQFPWLKYHTQQDSQVRPEHAVLDGYTAKVGDPAWGHIAPKNGWRCRCFLTAHETGVRSTRKLPKFDTAEFPAIFDMNPGVDKVIFDPKKHPYFFVERGDAELKKKNFNMVIP